MFGSSHLILLSSSHLGSGSFAPPNVLQNLILTHNNPIRKFFECDSVLLVEGQHPRNLFLKEVAEVALQPVSVSEASLEAILGQHYFLDYASVRWNFLSERMSSRQHLHYNYAARPNVTVAAVDTVFFELCEYIRRHYAVRPNITVAAVDIVFFKICEHFRRRIDGSAVICVFRHGVDVGTLDGMPREPEITDLHVVLVVDHDVPGLEVPVHYYCILRKVTFGMHHSHSPGDLLKVVEHLILRNRSFLLLMDHLCQVAAVVLHHLIDVPLFIFILKEMDGLHSVWRF